MKTSTLVMMVGAGLLFIIGMVVAIGQSPNHLRGAVAATGHGIEIVEVEPGVKCAVINYYNKVAIDCWKAQ